MAYVWYRWGEVPRAEAYLVYVDEGQDTRLLIKISGT
jgi:hypothetical protein